MVCNVPEITEYLCAIWLQKMSAIPDLLQLTKLSIPQLILDSYPAREYPPAEVSCYSVSTLWQVHGGMPGFGGETRRSSLSAMARSNSLPISFLSVSSGLPFACFNVMNTRGEPHCLFDPQVGSTPHELEDEDGDGCRMLYGEDILLFYLRWTM